ncbi:hypothetical protein ACH5RR_021401 [Cinchona calisaya]|uniref:Uncharacterized protein n=1 Tax=Cinchona calisaya TaxID=153742 RepID=A0ABD2ZK26_9GENT
MDVIVKDPHVPLSNNFAGLAVDDEMNNGEERYNVLVQEVSIKLVSHVDKPTFPQEESEFLPTGVFDNALAIVKLKINIKTGPKPFKFNQFLMKHPKFHKIWETRWAEHLQRDHMYTFCMKLNNLKMDLKALKKRHFNENAECKGCSFTNSITTTGWPIQY